MILNEPRPSIPVPHYFLIAGHHHVPRVGSKALISAATAALIRGGDPGLAAVAGTPMYEQQIG
jgi:hypothetical protein